MRSRDTSTARPTSAAYSASYHVGYKLCVLMHLVHRGCSPSYLSGLVAATANMPFWKRLRSVDTNHYEPLTTRL